MAVSLGSGFWVLGAVDNPKIKAGDLAIKELAKELGREDYFELTEVAVISG